jgi:hypothetical protein
MTKRNHWVEAQRAVKDPSRVIAYRVWRPTAADSRYGEVVGTFSVARKEGPAIALYLANMMRDDLNANID